MFAEHKLRPQENNFIHRAISIRSSISFRRIAWGKAIFHNVDIP